MNIDINSIMNKVEKYVTSPTGMAKIARLADIKIQNACEDLVNCIIDNLPDSIRSDLEASASGGSWIGQPVIKGNRFEIDITIPPHLLSRPSLDDSFDGVDNIVRLLNNGYHAKCYVYGYWESKGIYTYSLKDREPLHFMQDAINEYNNRYGLANGCFATLNESKYN